MLPGGYIQAGWKESTRRKRASRRGELGAQMLEKTVLVTLVLEIPVPLELEMPVTLELEMLMMLQPAQQHWQMEILGREHWQEAFSRDILFQFCEDLFEEYFV